MVKSKVFALTLIASLLFLTALCATVQAQNESTVTNAPTTGGTSGGKISTETTVVIIFVFVITIILIALGIYAARNK